MNYFLEKLLDYYNLSYEDYIKILNEDIKDIPHYSVFKQANNIAEYLKKSISENKKILIYGDYDCDGIMSVSILSLLLSKNSNKNIGYYIPSREKDGYGLTKENIDKFHKLNYDIIVCVDNGISLFEEIEYLNSLGMEAIILDHHEILGKIPNAKYIMHPDIDKIGDFNISAGEVCFYFSWAFLGKINDYYLVLAALSTLSDIMILKDYNRIIVKEALKIINNKKIKQIYALINKPFDYIVTEEDLQMVAIPKINSVGRLLNDDSRFLVVKFFISDDDKTIDKIANFLTELNNARKKITTNFDVKDIEVEYDPIIYINDNGEGVNGLIASTILNKFNRPAFVLSQSKYDNNLFKGSARSKSGFNIADALEDSKNLLINYGGHELAGGFTIARDNVENFKKNLSIFFKDHPFKNEEKKYIDIDLEDINLKNYDILRSFSPFGEGNLKPLFKLFSINKNIFNLSKDQKHIITKINNEASIVYFNFDTKILDKKFVDLIGSFNINIFKGYKTVQFNVTKFLSY